MPARCNRLASGRLLGLLALLFVAVPGRAALPNDSLQPEHLLQQDPLVYFRFDGLDPHQLAYEQTVLGKLLETELQPLVLFIKQFLADRLGPDAVAAQLLQGADPAQLQQLRQSAGQLPKLMAHLKQHGVAVAVEDSDETLPHFTLVFPRAGAEAFEAFRAGAHLIAVSQDREFRETEIDGQATFEVKLNDEWNLIAWKAAEHVVWSIGTSAAADRFAKRPDTEGPALTQNPIYKQVISSKPYETHTRGFLDVSRAGESLSEFVPAARPVLDELGVSGVHSVTFHVGFEGEYQRSTISLQTTGERKGLLAVLEGAAPIELDRLPVIAPSASSVSASGIHPVQLAEASSKSLRALMQATAPGQWEQFVAQWEEVEQQLGVQVKDDLLAHLGPTVAMYNSPDEAMFFLSGVVALEVKNLGPLKETLATLHRNVSNLPQSGWTVRTVKYRDSEMYLVHFGEDESFVPFTPALAVHKDWLVLGLLPQSIQGFVFRSGGQPSHWHASPLLEKLVQEVRGENKGRVIGFRQVDPRPTVRQILALAPIYLALLREIPRAQTDLDVLIIPNSQMVTERLSPNVSLMIDDGHTVRIESYSTLPLPIDLAGMNGLLGSPYLFLPFAF